MDALNPDLPLLTTVCSSRWPDAHRRVHPAAVEWREELRRKTQQTIHGNHPHGHPRVYRYVLQVVI